MRNVSACLCVAIFVAVAPVRAGAQTPEENEAFTLYRAAKIDMDAVIALAQVKHPKSNIYAKPSPGPYMSDPKLRTWVLKVVQKYFRELGTDPLMPGNEIPASSDATVPGPGKFIVGVAIVGTLGWAIWEAVTAVTPGAAPSQGEVAKHEAKASL